MDFQFTYYLGDIFAKCSMGHEAIANWLNTEVKSDPQIASNLLTYIQKTSQLNPADQLQLIGKEYSVFIHQDEVLIRANHLSMDNNAELEDNLYYYEEESISSCGLEDFTQFLHSYLTFKK